MTEKLTRQERKERADAIRNGFKAKFLETFINGLDKNLSIQQCYANMGREVKFQLKKYPHSAHLVRGGEALAIKTLNEIKNKISKGGN